MYVFDKYFSSHFRNPENGEKIKSFNKKDIREMLKRKSYGMVTRSLIIIFTESKFLDMYGRKTSNPKRHEKKQNI